MFDIGFTELLLIATISLLVIGPERLPETVRAVSLWIGRFKRSLRETRKEIEQQIGADEIRRELHNEEIMRSLEKIRHDVHVDLQDDDLSGAAPSVGETAQPSIQPPAAGDAGAAQAPAADTHTNPEEGAAKEDRKSPGSDPQPRQD